MSPDPAGTVDGLNLYQYSRRNPISNVDLTGRQAAPINTEVTASNTPRIDQVDKKADSGQVALQTISHTRLDAWNAAERAGYDNKSINNLTQIIDQERKTNGQDIFTQQNAYDLGSVRATAAESHWERRNWSQVTYNATLATIESVGGFGFGNTNIATAKNIGTTAALLIVFGLAIGIAGSVGYQLGKHFAGRNIPPTPAPVDLRGTAIVYSNGRHASIEVNGPSTLHTEQLTLGGGKQTTISAVDSPDEFAQTLKLSLPNAYNARLFQDLNLGMSLGPYSAKTNSCITHVGDVLRAGGITDVPRTTLDTIRFLKKQQGER